ncbi:uncharacterized protein BO95DRAFT_171034 [Aspergillus brunneoviolaceus CBS 621.78]|uniref:Uncharacterized protein n=1 Tax=Aspergillus brunneoviolaceus CBS 621.78 TaxID=1450534 RepID=A0ACD1G627_9EURO|nr:hypothetical protein BO95DRAFT_171034 [Aspergillus brunneoviolaceus CBS 621.78]RAH44581.1 hypothetical protein BO95DRAFT_171034 [Aspergillus brunneoviolaceus CBS 621.78]
MRIHLVSAHPTHRATLHPYNLVAFSSCQALYRRRAITSSAESHHRSPARAIQMVARPKQMPCYNKVPTCETILSLLASTGLKSADLEQLPD